MCILIIMIILLINSKLLINAKKKKQIQIMFIAVVHIQYIINSKLYKV